MQRQRTSKCGQLQQKTSGIPAVPPHKASPEREDENENNRRLGRAAGSHVPLGFGVQCDF